MKEKAWKGKQKRSDSTYQRYGNIHKLLLTHVVMIQIVFSVNNMFIERNIYLFIYD
jgi:hypothetical protein